MGCCSLNVGNTLPVGPEQIQHNLHIVQRQSHLPLTDDADKLSFCVEMETCTGKTYVYIKTIYELKRPVRPDQIRGSCPLHCHPGGRQEVL